MLTWNIYLFWTMLCWSDYNKWIFAQSTAVRTIEIFFPVNVIFKRGLKYVTVDISLCSQGNNLMCEKIYATLNDYQYSKYKYSCPQLPLASTPIQICNPFFSTSSHTLKAWTFIWKKWGKTSHKSNGKYNWWTMQYHRKIQSSGLSRYFQSQFVSQITFPIFFLTTITKK